MDPRNDVDSGGSSNFKLCFAFNFKVFMFVCLFMFVYSFMCLFLFVYSCLFIHVFVYLSNSSFFSRMVVLKLTNGDLWVYSPLELFDSRKKWLDSIGKRKKKKINK